MTECKQTGIQRRTALSAGSCLLIVLLAFNGASCLADGPDLAGTYYERALAQYRNNNVKGAIIELKNAVQQNRGYLAAQILLAEAYLKDKNLVAAEVALSQADKLGADPALLVTTRAQLYLYQLKYGLVLKEILPERFVAAVRPDLHIYRGHAYLQLNQLARALAEYDSAAQLDGGRVEPIIGRANVLLHLGNLQGAMKAAEQAAAMQPESADSFYILGAINHAQGALQEALVRYGQALAADADHLDARIARAGVLIDLHRDEEAEVDLRSVRTTYPFSAKAAYLDAVVLARNGRETEAKEALTAAAEALDAIQPEFLTKHEQSLLLMGLVNYSLKRFETAVHYLELYIRDYPLQPGPYKLLASILLDQGEYERVISLLNPALAYAPRDYRLLVLLARAYMHSGQHDRANALLEKAAGLEIRESGFHTELGLSRLILGQDDLALKELETELKTDPGNASAGIPLVLLYMSRGHTEQALRVAKDLQSRDPENLTLLNLLGRVQVRAGQRSEARNSFLEAIAIDPAFAAAQVNLSKLDVLEDKSDIAVQRMTKLIEQSPNSADLPYELATIYQSVNDFDSAAKWLQQALKVDGQFVAAKLALIELRLRSGHHAEALRLAQQASAQERDSPQVSELLARSFLANGNKGKAAGVLRVMSRSAGFDGKQLLRIAQGQIAAADHEGAIKSLKNAVAGNPYYVPARVALAEAELQFGEIQFARNQAEFLRDRFPDGAAGFRLLGDVAAREGKWSEAVAYYRNAFDREGNGFLLMRLYEALKRTGDDKNAVQLLEKWVAENDRHTAPVLALAEEYTRLGRLQEARQYYEQLLARFGKRSDIMNNLAYIYFKLGDERALSYAREAHELAPDQPGANDTLGWILVSQGQAEQGLHYLRNAHARLSSDPEIRYHIAVALYRLGRGDEALTELQEALQHDGPFPGRNDALQLMEELNR